jgi:Uma2 family endonuclease
MNKLTDNVEKTKYLRSPSTISRRMTITTFLKRYSDYEGDKVELDSGKVHMMGGASPLHEWLIIEISTQFKNYLNGYPCQPYGSNLYLKTGKNSVREPDVTIICDHSKFNNKVYEGVPELIVEVVSPSSKFIDLYDKKGEYYRLGVKEYWIVMSKDEVRVNVWSEDEYIEKVFISHEEILKVPVQLDDWKLVVEIDGSKIPKEII